MDNNKWYLSEGAELDVAVSTRVRLARNISGTPFPGRMSAAQAVEICERCKAAAQSLPDSLPPLDFFMMDSMDDSTRLMLVERHVISPDFANGTEGKALLLSRDESISIMVGEEDHLRIQVMRPGLDLEGAHQIAEQLDTLLIAALPIAFDEQLGFLTACPTNLGTGLRASVMLHLPALEQTKGIAMLTAAVSKIGLTLRGSYGEGSRPRAGLYQLSNQVTLGLSEADAIKNLSAVTGQVLAKERRARQDMPSLLLEDSVFRALGLLQNARVLSGEEFSNEISRVRLGLSMGIIEGAPVTLPQISELIHMAGAACIIKAAGRPLEAPERDQLRAAMVRQSLNKSTTE